QLETGLRHAQTPPSPMRRIISNIEVIVADEASGTFVVGSNFVLYEVAAQATNQLRIWPGRVIHRLRRIEGQLRMSEKIVELVTASLPQPNMAFLL
ncbi:MAG TPA: aromatic-ring-hydroxylating dioxygenase subunit beta, partial [Candidatus Binataceae bacterium]|nr:aromatic-ring-hydroxylating dioxygenase subunit beta [Candidatus Binataceae bacterium]